MLILNQQKYQTNLACCKNTRGVFAVFKTSQEDVSEINTRIIFWLLLANEFTKTYQYDSVGNRTATEVTGETWRYNANHQLESYGAEGNLTTYSYDDNGSAISKTDSTGTEEYLYDVAGRLTQVKKNSTVTVNYYYDPMGKRLWKEVNGQKTHFLYANEGMIAEYNNNGGLIQSYQYQPESMWGTAPLSMIKNGEANFYQHDQIGTPNLLTSKSGEVKWQGAVDAFGKVTTTTSSIDNAMRFPGQYFDSETGLHYNYFRDYDPKIGRYIQSDPIGLGGGVNTYGYVGGNPIMNTDSNGLFVCAGACVAAGVAISAAIDALPQLATNGGNVDCVSWTEVGISGALGAFGGGLLVGAAKHAISGKRWSQLSQKWRNVSPRYRKAQIRAGNAPSGDWDAHHWAFPRRGETGPTWRNHPLNLNPVPRSAHNLIHGNAPGGAQYGSAQRWWHGTPAWAKGAEMSVATGIGTDVLTSNSDCECN